MKTIKMLTILVLAVGLAAEVAKADFTFGEPINLGPPINTNAGEGCPRFTADGLSMFFESNQPGGVGMWDIWVSTRETVDDPWGEPVSLGPPVNTGAREGGPNISADGLRLFFASDRPGGYGDRDMWVTTRATVSDPWGIPVNLGPNINSSGWEDGSRISADGLTLHFTSDRPGGYGQLDIWMTTRPTVSDPWTEPVNLGPNINTDKWDLAAHVLTDGRVLLFTSGGEGTLGGQDNWIARRKTASDPWGIPVNLGPVINSEAHDRAPSLAPDGSGVYFHSLRPGGYGGFDIWRAPVFPVVDLNADGIVDSADICIMVESWGTDDPLCDIGPPPFGDGIVDVQDLIVLAEHLFEEPGLIAYWKLDETEGDIAYDSSGTFDGTLVGGPVWQPDGGMVEGALQLDGIDDYVSTPFVLNPADGKFCVFAWIKGGAPGKVVISQTGGVIWLCADTLEGNLMTELKASGRGASALLSQTNITDGNWHRIGLVWDGSHRTLYVDGVAVAEDAQTNLAGSDNGLYIGAGKAMEAGSFWSGLIDDVRIYNRAIIP